MMIKINCDKNKLCTHASPFKIKYLHIQMKNYFLMHYPRHSGYVNVQKTIKKAVILPKKLIKDDTFLI